MPQIKKIGDYTEISSPKEVLGSFIESGFGRQVALMWSEMIYNRSFREVTEYKEPPWQWLGLSQEYYNSNAPFWHSGYEEHNWEYLQGTRYYHTCGIESHKGISSLVLRTPVGGGVAGIRQEGIHLTAGREYEFRIYCGASIWESDPGINGFGRCFRTKDPCPVKVTIGDNEVFMDASGSVQEHCWNFSAKSTGVYPLEITFEWTGDLVCAYTSLMPTDNRKGWRRDVVDRISEAGPSVVRFPGGCFVSFYNWRSSVGPRERREPQESFYWGGLEENDVGLREFMELAEMCGFQGQICFNMMSSTPFDARCMVEYLNAPADTGYGRLRMLDGHEEPFGVQLFECDNEPARKWTAEEYASECVNFIREMRLVSPEAKFLMATYSYAVEDLPKMLEIAGQDVDFVIYRDGSPALAAKVLSILREYNARTGRNIRFTNTEWLPPCTSPEPFEELTISANYNMDFKIWNDYDKVFSRHQISWNYALNGAHQILEFISYGGEFALANFNNMTNTWGQNIVEASKDMAWLSCMGEVFALFHRQFCECTACAAECEDPLIFGLFTKTAKGKEQLYLINHGAAEKKLSIPQGFVPVDGLVGEKRSAHVTETEKPVRRFVPKQTEGKLELSGLSVVVLEKD